MNDADAAVLVLVAESWLRIAARDGVPPAGPVVDVLARLALAAPVAAARCPLLLRMVGPRVAWQVNAEAIALAASESTPDMVPASRWLSTGEAAQLLGCSPDTVRWWLRRGQLTGRRSERGWQVAAASVRQWRVQRAA